METQIPDRRFEKRNFVKGECHPCFCHPLNHYQNTLQMGTKVLRLDLHVIYIHPNFWVVNFILEYDRAGAAVKDTARHRCVECQPSHQVHLALKLEP